MMADLRFMSMTITLRGLGMEPWSIPINSSKMVLTMQQEATRCMSSTDRILKTLLSLFPLLSSVKAHDNTIIDGMYFGTVVNIFAEGVTVTGFTITHSGSNSNNAGILIHTPYNIITENNIQHNDYYGIRVIGGR